MLLACDAAGSSGQMSARSSLISTNSRASSFILWAVPRSGGNQDVEACGICTHGKCRHTGQPVGVR